VRVRVVASALLAACTSTLLVVACVGDDPDAQTETNPDGGGTDTGATGNDANAPDTASDAPGADAGPTKCSVESPFTDLAPVAGDVNTVEGSDQLGSLTADELDIFYFASGRAGYDATTYKSELYTSHRQNIQEPFSGAKRVLPTLSVGIDAVPNVNGNGTLLFFQTQRGDPSGFDIYRASRSDRSVEFGEPIALVGANVTGELEASPFISADGATVYFSWQATASTKLEIRKGIFSGTTLSGVAPLAGIVNDPVIDTGAPVLTVDELHLYFTRITTVNAASEVWRATRSTPSEAFRDAKPVTELNAPGANTPRWISPDGCRLYFDTNRERRDGGTGPRAWVASRAPTL
jgi:hypothetical protein